MKAKELYKLVDDDNEDEDEDEEKEEGEEKKKKFRELCDRYSEFACEETNILLFKKAPKFFAKAVRPSLASKKKKTVVDHDLLGTEDVELFEEYAEPALFVKLNAVEQVFVLARLVELGQKAKKREEGKEGERREGEELERSLRRCVALVEKVENQLRSQLIDKKEEEKAFEKVLPLGLDDGGFIEAEEEEERGRKSSVKGASGRAFKEGGDLGKMVVQVRTMQGKIIRVCVTKETTAEELKELMQKKFGILPDMQKIVFNDVQLSDTRTMSGCFIRNNDELKLMPRMLGGATDVQGQMGQMGQMEKGAMPGARMAMLMVGMARAGAGARAGAVASAGLGSRPRI
eukprot:MONOS_8717.1-p1 / transcript=MONOS_8717.1 / gene=MONOS_8717 / organism=Monocercomonoides_exilis_PA203 / gene_product=unspecified product / transcript_product=unspecified product / location=Mono_scaffold00336:5725-6825(+) / protein_length=344 / sequence_SO=supercontig / SO=protein_coding / is_pseudo=false